MTSVLIIFLALEWGTYLNSVQAAVNEYADERKALTARYPSHITIHCARCHHIGDNELAHKAFDTNTLEQHLRSKCVNLAFFLMARHLKPAYRHDVPGLRAIEILEEALTVIETIAPA